MHVGIMVYAGYTELLGVDLSGAESWKQSVSCCG